MMGVNKRTYTNRPQYQPLGDAIRSHMAAIMTEPDKPPVQKRKKETKKC